MASDYFQDIPRNWRDRVTGERVEVSHQSADCAWYQVWRPYLGGLTHIRTCKRNVLDSEYVVDEEKRPTFEQEAIVRVLADLRQQVAQIRLDDDWHGFAHAGCTETKTRVLALIDTARSQHGV